MLLVAHRLSTVVDAHQIAMCAGGAVIASGTHDVLLDTCPEYARLVKRQLGGGANGSVASGLNALGKSGSVASALDRLELVDTSDVGAPPPGAVASASLGDG